MAVRIAGVNIPEKKHTRIALRSIYGVGPRVADNICVESGIDGATKIMDLTEAELDKIRSVIDQADFSIEGDLRREVSMNIKRKMDLGTYQGRRHRMGLPVRGQRTKTNAKTRKGRGRKK